ncbi:hypothetical protein, partial [Xenorhabdus vietnamensis]|uniref:hypothetical protein n=1 Tax=Xenorhabdus vietnamensis TaxID=351656 RepID=UPI0030DAE2FA
MYPTCRTIVRALTSTLTTTALYGSRLRGFEAGFRQRTSVGLPPSPPELMLHTGCAPYAASLYACGTL